MTTPSNIKRGVHGEGSRFMSLAKLSLESPPRIMPIAGMLSMMTVDDLCRPVCPDPPVAGKWKYYKVQSDETPFGFVIVETPYVLEQAKDPVALVAMSADVGVPMPDMKNEEIIVMVDRGDPVVSDPSLFEAGKFYVFADAQGKLDIAWQADPPTDGQQIVGTVLYAQLPVLESEKKGSGGFAELSDDFAF
eukprot:CAMPEP_0185159460 /NCGR_PEP_ID=MMETSP1139-20130426/3059_1 /TAXON_ID=298111 /ORGANISM="Pavlova sp., Strain CCMP459" /LENGTH=190 /DNA_ID=CAMNT_0027724633 /DNA_START=75 /DNA_END=647 /DNA_ORIENTATION=+